MGVRVERVVLCFVRLPDNLVQIELGHQCMAVTGQEYHPRDIAPCAFSQKLWSEQLCKEERANIVRCCLALKIINSEFEWSDWGSRVVYQYLSNLVKQLRLGGRHKTHMQGLGIGVDFGGCFPHLG